MKTKVHKAMWLRHALKADVVCLQESYTQSSIPDYRVYNGIRRFNNNMKKEERKKILDSADGKADIPEMRAAIQILVKDSIPSVEVFRGATLLAVELTIHKHSYIVFNSYLKPKDEYGKKLPY